MFLSVMAGTGRRATAADPSESGTSLAVESRISDMYVLPNDPVTWMLQDRVARLSAMERAELSVTLRTDEFGGVGLKVPTVEKLGGVVIGNQSDRAPYVGLTKQEKALIVDLVGRARADADVRILIAPSTSARGEVADNAAARDARYKAARAEVRKNGFTGEVVFATIGVGFWGRGDGTNASDGQQQGFVVLALSSRLLTVLDPTASAPGDGTAALDEILGNIPTDPAGIEAHELCDRAVGRSLFFDRRGLAAGDVITLGRSLPIAHNEAWDREDLPMPVNPPRSTTLSFSADDLRNGAFANASAWFLLRDGPQPTMRGPLTATLKAIEMRLNRPDQTLDLRGNWASTASAAILDVLAPFARRLKTGVVLDGGAPLFVRSTLRLEIKLDDRRLVANHRDDEQAFIDRIEEQLGFAEVEAVVSDPLDSSMLVAKPLNVAATERQRADQELKLEASAQDLDGTQRAVALGIISPWSASAACYLGLAEVGGRQP